MRYKFVMIVKRRGGHPGYSEYQVITNSPPAGGTCQVSPLSGITLETIFTFTCSDWQDHDSPLRYEFIYFTGKDSLNVAYKGVTSSKDTKLPAGEKTNNFTIDFRVRVTDAFGAFTEVKTPVQVRTSTSSLLLIGSQIVEKCLLPRLPRLPKSSLCGFSSVGRQ